MKRVLPVVIICISLLIACKKVDVPNSDQDQLPADLVLKRSTYTSGPKVYSSTGEVADTALIAAAKISTGYSIITFRDYTYSPTDYPTMYFTGTATALNLRNGLRIYSVVRNGEDFVFISNDSTVYQIPSLGNGLYDSYISEPFFKYAQFSPAGNGSIVKREKYYASGNYSKLTVKGVVLTISRRDPVTKAYLSKSFSSSYNVFNVNAIQTLGRYDTLIVRPFDLVYEKK